MMNHLHPLHHIIPEQQDIRDATLKLSDKMAIFAITFGSISTIGSLSRILRFDLTWDILLDLCAYIFLVIIILVRRKLPLVTVIVLCLGILTAASCIGFFFSGLLTVNFALLTSCCVVAGALLGYRTGLALLFGSIGLIAIPAVLFSMGKLENVYDPGTYLRTPHAWVSHLSGYFIYALAGLMVIHFIQNQLWDSLKKLHQRSGQLHTSEKKYRLLAESMRDVLLTIDPDFMITYVSPSVSGLFGFTPLELTGTPVESLSGATGGATLTEIFTRYLANPELQSEIPFEFPFRRKDGTVFPAELTPSPIRDGSETFSGIQAILRDISERKRAEREKVALEEQLHQSEKMQMIGQFAGGIVHDYNNQLAGIMGFAELIKSEYPQESETHEAANSILNIARRAADLTSQLLAFARKGNYVYQDIDLHFIVREIVSILSHSIDPSIIIVQRLEASPTYSKGDPGQIHNALLNIALNARDAMPQGGTLLFTTRTTTVGEEFRSRFQKEISPGRYVQITISDTGHGIEETIMDRIFEPFFTTKAPGKGTGMGLAAVYGTVQAHKGIVDVRSEVSKGSSFHIYLPLCDAETPPAGHDAVAALTPGSGRILLIEDDANVQKVISMVLKKTGYTIDSFGDATEAIERYRAAPFDAVVLDLILPSMNGMDVLKQLRSINGSVRILLCSGFSPDGEVRGLLDDRYTFFIKKPFTLGELSDKVSTLLDSSRAVQE